MTARRRFLSALLAALLTLGLGAACGGDGEAPTVTVMSRNMYLGADLGVVLEPEPGANLLELIDQVWEDIVASDLPIRAEAMADEILAAEADLVGLQEAMRYELAGDDPLSLDFVQLLLRALEERGEEYELVVDQVQFGGSFPTSFGEVSLEDRDAIIVRAAAGLELEDASSGQFGTAFEVPNPLGGTVRVIRGWTAVNVIPPDAEPFRFVNTHLEAFDEAIRVEQATELLADPLSTELPVVLVGDLNSAAPGGPAYELVLDDGTLLDAWVEAGAADAGLTCCWEGDLRTQDSLDSRIDLVLVSEEITVEAVDVVGEDPADRVATAAGEALWPSDHAGVVAILDLPEG